MTTKQMPLNRDRLHDRLVELLPSAAMQWVEESCEAVASIPDALLFLSASAGLRCGRAPLGTDFPDWTVDDAVRALILSSLRVDGPELGEAVERVYRQGDGAERRAVLRALPLLDVDGHAVRIVQDALRTNDPRLVAAALGPYSAEHLDQPAWRDGVLKCLFMGVPLLAVADLDRRIDPELIRMFRDYEAERLAAGRPVPVALRTVLEAWGD